MTEEKLRKKEEPELSTHLWLVLFKAFQTLKAHDERSIESTGLCLSDFAVLEALLHKGPLPVNVIGSKVLLTSGSITSAVDRLEKKGYVQRQPVEGDRRVRLVSLTDSGKALIEEAFTRHQDALVQATSGLNTEEKEQLSALLKKLGKEAFRLLTP